MPTLVEDFALTFVPAHWLPWVRIALEVPTALALTLAAFRPLLALIPAGNFRAWVDAVDKVLNVASVNTKALSERIAPRKRP